MKRALLVWCLTFFACPGLLTAPGNDFPCDFSKPIGQRDAVCSAGDVCGVNNRCQRFQYEGPQFEGLPTFPDFSAKVDAGASLHPRITGEVDFVARVQGRTATVMHTPQGYFLLSRQGATPMLFSTAVEPTALEDVVIHPRLSGSPPNDVALTGITRGREVYCEFNPPTNRLSNGPLNILSRRLRVVGFEDTSESIGVIQPLGSGAGRVVVNAGAVFTSFALPSNIQVFDLAPGPRFRVPPPVNLFRSVVIAASDGLRALGPDGGTELIFPMVIPDSASLATDPSASVFALMSLRGGKPNLSTFTLARVGSEFQVATPWGDCMPCMAPRAFTASTDVLGPFIEVLCEEGVRRVRGTESTAAGADCRLEPVTPSWDTSKVATVSSRNVGMRDVAQQDFSSTTGFIGAGKNGEVWVGSTISNATPFFLDRVPRDVASLGTRGTDELFALTQPGVFVHDADAGFFVLAPEVTSRIEALVNQGQGWVVGEQGNLVLIENLKKATLSTKFGPRLIDGRGQPITSALRGEAITDLDGGLVSMVIAADDSLYFVPAPEPMLQSGKSEVTAQLTPEPSTLIRSLALERSPVGTNGVDRVRGYLVTSRNVYEFNLGGAPLRWTATPLQLSAAEPVEVWFDNPRGGLGRVGYRDGTVFSTPGGFQLTEPLPAVDGGVPAAVLDYENLGGWPVAYTSVGIFVARYDKLESGRLDSRFADGGVNKPMTWREVTLPDGTRPWLRKGPRAEALPGRLHVITEPQTGSDRAYRRRFRLLVFLPGGVLELGQHERTNISTIVE